jgi:hypothetical protein
MFNEHVAHSWKRERGPLLLLVPEQGNPGMGCALTMKDFGPRATIVLKILHAGIGQEQLALAGL